ncbi:MAG TPA: ParB/RepB/Spo0J family partition protein [Gammaproteobacteria bacterium]|jgi:ParB family chromosome partitioning protein|nr:chromosome partitioning protein ParB [Gammaproteobacteria bacterium]HJL80311.1 ParB/RepB/Spo0J family partition protein [Gammaproteobacteria bacterium]HJM08973.1 ParB/RepB/Spo0J family partition protein [Gammaproteobacteria bacterium]HJN01090.1 ParB/RepB/Spo0J family partition protein [Gammaproteobacteria bacterium]|tara:strand:- start:5971 stop:6849 length:879 start_codon:yes stop_codon:yes gene_type:complete
MSDKRKSLGRGLDALLGQPGEADTKKQKQGLTEISIEHIGPGPFQPRKQIEESQLSELAQSIKAQGVIQPIVVRERALADSHTGVKFEIIAGERRWRASQMAGLESIPAVVRTIADSEAVAVALIENIQRENLNPLEEASAFQRLIIEYEMSHQEVANSVGRARTSITNALRLLDLPSSVQELVNKKELTMGHARALLSIQDRGMQLEVANLIVEKGLSVREAEGLVRKIVDKKKPNKPKPPTDPDIQRLENDLTNRLGAKVSIKHKKSGGGTLSIKYTSSDELEGILSKIK